MGYDIKIVEFVGWCKLPSSYGKKKITALDHPILKSVHSGTAQKYLKRPSPPVNLLYDISFHLGTEKVLKNTSG